METNGNSALAYSPQPPLFLEGLGIPKSVVLDLVLRHLYIEGLSSLDSLHQALRLSLPIVETIFRQFRQHRGERGRRTGFV